MVNLIFDRKTGRPFRIVLQRAHSEISGQFHRKHCFPLPQASSKCLEHKNAGRSFKYGLTPKLKVSKSMDLIGPVITRACA